MAHVLEESDLSLVTEKLSGVTADWYELGVHLGIKTGKLKKIGRAKYDNKLLEMMTIWLKTADPQPCWEAIVAALNKGSLAEQRLVQSIREKYCKEKEDEDEHTDTNSAATKRQRKKKKKKRDVTKDEDDANSEDPLQQLPQIQHQEEIQGAKETPRTAATKRKKAKKKAITEGLEMSQSSDAREEMEPTATRSSETPTQEINEESPPLFSGSTRASNKRAGSSNETDEPRPKRSKQDNTVEISCQSCQEHVFSCKDCFTKIMTMRSRQENESQDEVPCTNAVKGCSWKGKTTEVVKHHHECPKQEMSCPLSAAGCQAKFLRENCDSHIQKHIQRLEEAQKCFQLRTPPLIFKVENVYRYLDDSTYRLKRNNKFEEYSPPFYTHPGGYKMKLCVRVEVSGRESRIDVFPEAMPDKYNESLSFGQKAEVLAMILHCSDKNKHYLLKMGEFEFRQEQTYKISDLGHMIYPEGPRFMKITGFPRATVNIKYHESDSAKEPSILQRDYFIGGALYIQVAKVDLKYIEPWLLTPTPCD